ncbi:MAG: hypothetical protein ABUL62_02405 [Myxococcales bacterium]
MKYGTWFASLAGLAILAASSSARAEPRAQLPLGARPAPPVGGAPRAAHEEHRDAEHQETEAQIRARLQKEQQDERAKRQLAKKDTRTWDASREQRAAEARARVASTWGDLAEQPEAKAELATHAERMAQLNRILDVAQDQGDTALVARTNGVIQREIARDTRVLQGIRAKVGAR